MFTADKVIIGGGIYGLYFALECAKRQEKVLVIEYDHEVFSRASFLNQSRIHNGYHYPRSLSTAIKSALYFERFSSDYPFCIHNKFKSIYAISDCNSKVSAAEFESFCKSINVHLSPLENWIPFKNGMCETTFETNEYTYDAQKLKHYFLVELTKYENCIIQYNARISAIYKEYNYFVLDCKSGEKFKTYFILNATYGSTNQILHLAGFPLFDVKYELCEIILCEVCENFRNIGITVMDGPFFSLIPFGNTGMHALSSVIHTPHKTSNDLLPIFDCQQGVECSGFQLQNCNICPNKPKSNWPLMYEQVKQYLNIDIEFKYCESMYSVKVLLNSSEIDDSRPTLVKKYSESPYFTQYFQAK